MTNKLFIYTSLFILIYILITNFNILKTGKNLSISLDHKWFIASSLFTPKKGDLVAFYAPRTHVIKKKIIFVKKVLGTMGDKITVNKNIVKLNNKSLIAKTHSKQGRKLEPINSKTIPYGKYFVYTTHKDSYDSRYKEIGLIHESQLIGKAWGF